MEAFRVQGGGRIGGIARAHAAKNAVLPIMAAAILSGGEVTLEDCPDISDVRDMAGILKGLGCEVDIPRMRIDSSHMNGHEMPESLSKRIRSSIFMLGPILSRMRRATVPYPGGCEIGVRPIDLHISGLRRLGVEIRDEGGILYCDGRNMRPCDVFFDYPSVGATENVMMAAVLLRGVTTINNAAREPEIVDLQRFINAMGGRVSGAGTQQIVVQGVEALHSVTYRPMPDRIVAGTLLAAAAITGGELTLLDARPDELTAVTEKLREMGCELLSYAGNLHLSAPKRLRAFAGLQTQPHPGFPTDMQVQFLALASVAEGTSVVMENVFENRFTHAGELNSMGANIRVNGRMAIVRGADKLRGMTVHARDLRGGAALVLAGLAAQGETLVTNAEYIDRGYEHLEAQLGALGADITRVTTSCGKGYLHANDTG